MLVLGGHDQDNSLPPDPDRVEKGRHNIPQADTAFSASRVNIVVPEVHDPVKDRNIALENARMSFPLYPQAEVVQTGPGVDDWMVCTSGPVRNPRRCASRGHTRPDAPVVPLGLDRAQTRLDIPQAFAVRELRERHAEKLIPAREARRTVGTSSAAHASSTARTRSGRPACAILAGPAPAGDAVERRRFVGDIVTAAKSTELIHDQ